MKTNGFLIGAILCLAPTFAAAQQQVSPMTVNGATASGGPKYCSVGDGSAGSCPLPVSATITPSGTQDVNQKQVNGATINVGVGAAGTGTQRVTTSTDSTIGAVTAITNALPAGTNLLGKTGIDQTTPGTTNGVVVNSSALPTGAATSANQPSNSAQGATTSGQTGTLGMMATTTAPPTDTNAQTNPMRGDTHGGLRIVCQDTNGTVCDFTLPTIVIQSSQYPNASTPVSCSTGNIAAATATCTMPATSGKFTYITGFDITASGATVGSVVTCTLTNTGSGTHSYTFAATAGALLSDTPLIKTFSTPLKATASNTSPVLSCPSLGTGNTNMTINADGYQL